MVFVHAEIFASISCWRYYFSIGRIEYAVLGYPFYSRHFAAIYPLCSSIPPPVFPGLDCVCFAVGGLQQFDFADHTRYKMGCRRPGRSESACLLSGNQQSSFLDGHRCSSKHFRGVAFVLAAMGDSLSGVLDVTIAYPDNDPDALIWQLLQGKIPRIVARVRLVPVLEDVAGKDYLADSDFKERMQSWVNRIWQDKDMLINSILSARGA